MKADWACRFCSTQWRLFTVGCAFLLTSTIVFISILKLLSKFPIHNPMYAKYVPLVLFILYLASQFAGIMYLIFRFERKHTPSLPKPSIRDDE